MAEEWCDQRGDLLRRETLYTSLKNMVAVGVHYAMKNNFLELHHQFHCKVSTHIFNRLLHNTTPIDLKHNIAMLLNKANEHRKINDACVLSKHDLMHHDWLDLCG